MLTPGARYPLDVYLRCNMMGVEQLYIPGLQFDSVEKLRDLLRVIELEEAASIIWSMPDLWGPDQHRTGSALQQSVLELGPERLVELGLGKERAAKLVLRLESAGVYMSTRPLLLVSSTHTTMM